jgi:flagellar basal-body rod protein FlgC
MTDLLDGAAQAASGLRAQSMRLRLVSENIANADTPGYHRKLTSFDEVVERGRATGEVATGPVHLDPAEAEKIYDPGHPLADTDGFYEGSNVNLVVEIADAREAQRSYEANLRMFDQTRQMSRSLLDLLRR